MQRLAMLLVIRVLYPVQVGIRSEETLRYRCHGLKDHSGRARALQVRNSGSQVLRLDAQPWALTGQLL